MHETLRGMDAACLERSCSRRPSSIRFGASAYGVERAEVYLSGVAFEPHRHDTYAIGLTTFGVQTFRYRGARRICLPGQIHVLHPDETHDGAPATTDGLGYRIVYVAPALIREVLGASALPFVSDPVQDRTGATNLLGALLHDVDEPVTELGRLDIITIIADTLRSLSGSQDSRIAIDLRAMEAVRDHLRAHACERSTPRMLEQLAGLDRFSIARQFRRAFGTSPDRYRTMRRLELARSAIEAGTPLAEVAADTGFADQAHMTRQFKRAYGLTPARWATAIVNGGPALTRGHKGAR